MTPHDIACLVTAHFLKELVLKKDQKVEVLETDFRKVQSDFVNHAELVKTEMMMHNPRDLFKPKNYRNKE